MLREGMRTCTQGFGFHLSLCKVVMVEIIGFAGLKPVGLRIVMGSVQPEP